MADAANARYQGREGQILKTTTKFCQALINPPSPRQLLSSYFTPATSPKITEHGPVWARSRLPFLAHTFTGLSECESYFQLLAETLEMEMTSNTFPGDDGFIVDAKAKIEGEDGPGGVVSVVGKAHFKAKKTGKGWDEQFYYRFSGFDEDGKIGHWEIWADPLSAWMAVGAYDQDGELH